MRLLELHGVTSIHDMVEATGASESTIRRDFIELERDGRLVRVRGGVRLSPDGAISREVGIGGSLDRRAVVNREKKRRIARQACSYLRDGETVFIDGGSTTYFMVEFLAAFTLKIVTNSFAVARLLVGQSKCTVILPEGTIDPDSQLILNSMSADPFSNYSGSKAFMGIEGVTGSMLTNDEELVIRTERAMIEHAQELIVLADGSKFGAVGHLTLCPPEKASRIITTLDADQSIVGELREKGVEVVEV